MYDKHNVLFIKLNVTYIIYQALLLPNHLQQKLLLRFKQPYFFFQSLNFVGGGCINRNIGSERFWELLRYVHKKVVS